MASSPPAGPVESTPPPEPKPQPPAAEDEAGEASAARLLLQFIPSWLGSFILHVVIIVLLALIPILVPRKVTVDLVAGEATPEVESPVDIRLDPLETPSNLLENDPLMAVAQPELQPLTEAPQLEQLSDALSIDQLLKVTDFGAELSGQMPTSPFSADSEFAGRSKETREAIGRPAGMTKATEAAVVLGLQWLAAHQLPDGSWNFNHQIGPGSRSSPNPGQYEDCPVGATGLCLLAFLGNGQTHLEGDYKEVVNKALVYLVGRQVKVNAFAGSLTDPNGHGAMYSHAIATIALAEAYAMTRDNRLRDPAQAALNYIALAQDPNGGGWRYQPREPGDLSVTGWMLMALKSGLMGDLEIPRPTIRKAQRFLDNASFDSGSRYGYRVGNRDPGATMTAVGLLCRMYTGWKRENPALERGVRYLARRGPTVGAATNMYFNYYAAQVLRQYGGTVWADWNKIMRDDLVTSQSTTGATKGSWYFNPGNDLSVSAGGRLYCTAMAVMTLEVYYRFLPIYRDEIVDVEFPLD